MLDLGFTAGVCACNGWDNFEPKHQPKARREPQIQHQPAFGWLVFHIHECKSAFYRDIPTLFGVSTMVENFRLDHYE